MNYVNMLEAKTSLSRLVEDVETGRETEIIIARSGRPVARLVPLEPAPPIEQRIGIAKGAFDVPDDIDAHNEDVAALFRGDVD
ncbi:type II toxin-antitoxin system Phd/YefM family antitoxin [Paraburkholderia bannensis]|uniref:type II toxin-antitoxin system Phd/YefM family antitoxin n=1 Tax=Paraburkholderia bannensis TaxID=765414 RepID=UPI002AC33C1C|nr:type II toxin-antitoxin system prevent-host-death family antitoxin [Paraburkholderia bannensis]